MRVGTRSLLFGVHQVVIHPIFTFVAWWRLYGFPWDPRLWILFIVHDWGYWGKPNMNGPEGERHPMLGARIMHWFDRPGKVYWRNMALYHSRFLSASEDPPRCPSKFCWADKYTFLMYPRWLYLVLSHLSAEIHEYTGRIVNSNSQKYKDDMPIRHGQFGPWHDGLSKRIHELLLKEIRYDARSKRYVRTDDTYENDDSVISTY